jgi:hypothetical protein
MEKLCKHYVFFCFKIIWRFLREIENVKKS